MKRFLIFIPAFCFLFSSFATTYTEFYVQTTGNNLNAGSTTNDAAVYSSTNGIWNGTGIFTPTDGTTPASIVAAGDFASVYTNGQTVAWYIGRVTAVGAGANGTITVSTTAKAGTAPGANTGGMTIKTGGAWAGPNTTGTTTNEQMFPFNFVVNVLTNLGPPRVNIKSGTYSVTNPMVDSASGPILWSGYKASPGDGGRATIDGGTNMPGYPLLTLTGSYQMFGDLIFNHNGTNGSSMGVASVPETIFWRCIFINMRGAGLVGALGNIVVESEAATNNLSNTASTGGFNDGSTTTFIRCWSHNNSGSNSSGFYINTTGSALSQCISSFNGRDGVNFGGTLLSVSVNNCDFYNNASNGFGFSRTSYGTPCFQNNNFFKNRGFAIAGINSLLGLLFNNCFGAGTQTNSLGNFNSSFTNAQTLWNVQNSINYAADATPWVDPTNCNFTLKASASTLAAGRGSFTQSTVNSPTNTVSYPDVGAAQSASTNTTASGGGEHSYSSAP